MQSKVLIGLFFCHFLADFTPLSTAWMLKGKKLGDKLFPIFSHALVHALLMLAMLAFMFKISGSKLTILFFIQLVTHFIIDVWKGRMNVWFPATQSPESRCHWFVFGFDQYLHSIVIIHMSYYAVSYKFTI